jgi:site-specific recombinase XerD
VKAPKLPNELLEPIPLEDVNALVAIRMYSFSKVKDKAMVSGLLDTGARAQEFLNINLEDVELAAGAMLIRQGKGHKPRLVFLGRKTVRTIRAYFRSLASNISKSVPLNTSEFSIG